MRNRKKRETIRQAPLMAGILILLLGGAVPGQAQEMSAQTPPTIDLPSPTDDPQEPAVGTETGGEVLDLDKEERTMIDDLALIDPSKLTAEQKHLIDVKKKLEQELRKPDLVNPVPSLFFTPTEYRRIRDAISGKLAVRPEGAGGNLSVTPSGGKSAQGEGPLMMEGDPSTRELLLGGIMYVSDTEWIIWLNNTRITPNRVLKQIREMNVHKSYVDLKWYDPKTGETVPIRLRPSQRFSLDARRFLPG